MHDGYTQDSPEQWRVIEGFPEYAVSSWGRVRSSRQRPTRMLKTRRGNPYVQVSLCTEPTKHVTKSVHVLVCEAFHGPRPEGMQVRHLNGDHTDNRASNLQWGTATENALDRVAHGRHEKAAQLECKYGHPFDDVNTYRNPRNGRRACKTCRRAYLAEWRTNRALRAASVPTGRAA